MTCLICERFNWITVLIREGKPICLECAIEIKEFEYSSKK